MPLCRTTLGVARCDCHRYVDFLASLVRYDAFAQPSMCDLHSVLFFLFDLVFSFVCALALFQAPVRDTDLPAYGIGLGWRTELASGTRLKTGT